MINESIQLGDAVEHRGVLIAPLFPRDDPKAEHLTHEEALLLGFRVTEVDAAGSVPELLAFNLLDTPVLLYDGEELLGAKQNWIRNVTVLVAAKSETRIPVSCVEQGRWHARSASFEPARDAAYPDLRRRKAERLSAEPLARRVAQAAVWDEIAAKAGRHGVHSPTGATADIYEERGHALTELRRAFRSSRASREQSLRSATSSSAWITSLARRRSPASIRSSSTATSMASSISAGSRQARTGCRTSSLRSQPCRRAARPRQGSATTFDLPATVSSARASRSNTRGCSFRPSRATAATRAHASRAPAGAADGPRMAAGAYAARSRRRQIE